MKKYLAIFLWRGILFYKTTQRLPLGTVTVTPLFIIIGPDDVALYPVGIVVDTLTTKLFIINPLFANACGNLDTILIFYP